MNRKTFLAERRKGLGGTDIAAIAGLNPRRGPLEVYAEKLGLVPDQPDAPQLERGRMLEPIVARKYALATKRRLMRVASVVRHQHFEFLAGSPDRLFRPKGAGDLEPKGVVEIKTHALPVFARAKNHGLPEAYVAQLQWYLGLTGLPVGAYAVFSAERWELIHFDVEFSPEIYARLLEVGVQFWHDHIEKQVPPTPGAFNVPVEVAKSGAELVSLDTPEVREAIEMYAEAKAIEATGLMLKDQARTNIIATLIAARGEQHHGAFQAENGLIYFREQGGRSSFDKKALAAARPIDRTKLLAIAADYAKRDGVVVRTEHGETVVPPDVAASLLQTVVQNDGWDISVNLTQFEKQGSPFEVLKVYPRGEEQEKSES